VKYTWILGWLGLTSWSCPAADHRWGYNRMDRGKETRTVAIQACVCVWGGGLTHWKQHSPCELTLSKAVTIIAGHSSVVQDVIGARRSGCGCAPQRHGNEQHERTPRVQTYKSIFAPGRMLSRFACAARCGAPPIGRGMATVAKGPGHASRVAQVAVAAGAGAVLASLPGRVVVVLLLVLADGAARHVCIFMKLVYVSVYLVVGGVYVRASGGGGCVQCTKAHQRLNR
jgi:hypothetical protein